MDSRGHGTFCRSAARDTRERCAMHAERSTAAETAIPFVCDVCVQLLSWVVFSLLGMSFHLFLLPSFSSSLHRIVFALAYWLAAGPMVYFGARMTASESLDEIVAHA